MTKLLLPIAAIAMLSLAACDNAPDAKPAASVETQPDGSTTVQVQVPDSMVSAVEAIANPQATFNDLSARAGQMTDQAKQDAVVNARRAAEAGARGLGQTPAEVTEAGDVAERSARDALGL